MTPRAPHSAAALLALSLIIGCGLNNLALGAFQYGTNLGGMVMDNLHDSNDQDVSVDPESMRARSRQACP